MSDTPRNCRTCWCSAGTQRRVVVVTHLLGQETIVKRYCRFIDMMVITVGTTPFSCSEWKRRPPEPRIAKAANRDAKASRFKIICDAE